VKAVARSK